MSRILKRASVLVFPALLALAPRVASAGDTQACDAAYDQAQTLRDAKKLVAAREQLRVCARRACPGFMVKDCTAWLAEAESRIPSVVLVASDATGAAQPDVTASIDGAGTPRKLDGTSWDVDPGQHSFAFFQPDGTKVETSVLVVEGQKAQRVAVTFGKPHPEPAVVQVPDVAPAPTGPRAPFPYKPVGYGVGGAGVLGIVIGSIFGVEALSTKSKNCDSAGACSPGSASTALSQGTISTVGFVAGGILAAGGVTLVVLGSRSHDAHAARLEAVPLVGSAGDGAMLRGTW